MSRPVAQLAGGVDDENMAAIRGRRSRLESGTQHDMEARAFEIIRHLGAAFGMARHDHGQRFRRGVADGRCDPCLLAGVGARREDDRTPCSKRIEHVLKFGTPHGRRAACGIELEA
ncbi:MAG: hypothetical protein MUC40_07670, partial [Akkermansiaceae bacterium]|nr:hypothetical protein [Akkermansiaceae bacterium]